MGFPQRSFSRGSYPWLISCFLVVLLLSHLRSTLDLPIEILKVILQFYIYLDESLQEQFIKLGLLRLSQKPAYARSNSFLLFLMDIKIPDSIHAWVIDQVHDFALNEWENFLLTRPVFALLECYFKFDTERKMHDRLFRKTIAKKVLELETIIVASVEGKDLCFQVKNQTT